MIRLTGSFTVVARNNVTWRALPLLWVIFDGLIEDCRQVDVRSCPENAEPGPSQKFLAMGQTPVIQAPRLGARIMRYELADYEWTAIRPMLPNKPRGVPRVNDRRVLNGIFWVLRSGAPWRDLSVNFGPYTTCYNRFVRWRRAGVWAKIMSALAAPNEPAAEGSREPSGAVSVGRSRHLPSVPRNRTEA